MGPALTARGADAEKSRAPARDLRHGRRPRQRRDVATAPASSRSPAAAKPALTSRRSSRVPMREPRPLVDRVERVRVLRRERAAAGQPGDLAQRLRVGRDGQDLAVRASARPSARAERDGEDRDVRGAAPRGRRRPGRGRPSWRRPTAARSPRAGASLPRSPSARSAPASASPVAVPPLATQAGQRRAHRLRGPASGASTVWAASE